MGRVAVIDDARICRLPIRVALEASGHTVREIEPHSVFDVMAILRAGPPDLVITDLEMPSCKGMSLIRTIREDPVLKDTPILVVSSHREESMVAGLSQMCIQGFLIKPVKPQRVASDAAAILEALADLQSA